MKHVPRSQQHHDFYAKYRHQDSKISALLGECGFKGDSYDELKAVAPWIVRLEADNPFTRNLFTRSDAAWHLWDHEPGVFVCSRASLEDLQRHFRRFTRIRDEADKWYFFRFWDEIRNAAAAYGAAWVEQLFFHAEDMFVIRSDTSLYCLALRAGSLPKRVPLLLTEAWRRDIALTYGARYALRVMAREHRSQARTLAPPLRREWAWQMAVAFQRYNLRRTWSRERYMALSMTFGTRFDQDITLPGVLDILSRDEPCYVRMLDLENRISAATTHVCGDQYEHYARALERFAALDEGQVRSVVTSDDPLAVVLRLFPRKAQTLSAERLEGLSDRCNALAEAAFAPPDRRAAAVMFFAHTFILGEGSLNDPLHDYLRRIWKDNAPDRLSRLVVYGQKRARAQIRRIRKLTREG